jgi:hypothetical protein
MVSKDIAECWQQNLNISFLPAAFQVGDLSDWIV